MRKKNLPLITCFADSESAICVMRAPCGTLTRTGAPLPGPHPASSTISDGATRRRGDGAKLIMFLPIEINLQDQHCGCRIDTLLLFTLALLQPKLAHGTLCAHRCHAFVNQMHGQTRALLERDAECAHFACPIGVVA